MKTMIKCNKNDNDNVYVRGIAGTSYADSLGILRRGIIQGNSMETSCWE